MLGTRLTSQDIAAHIREAGETCLLIAPGVEPGDDAAFAVHSRRGSARGGTTTGIRRPNGWAGS